MGMKMESVNFRTVQRLKSTIDRVESKF